MKTETSQNNGSLNRLFYRESRLGIGSVYELQLIANSDTITIKIIVNTNLGSSLPLSYFAGRIRNHLLKAAGVNEKNEEIKNEKIKNIKNKYKSIINDFVDELQTVISKDGAFSYSIIGLRYIRKNTTIQFEFSRKEITNIIKIISSNSKEKIINNLTSTQRRLLKNWLLDSYINIEKDGRLKPKNKVETKFKEEVNNKKLKNTNNNVKELSKVIIEKSYKKNNA